MKCVFHYVAICILFLVVLSQRGFSDFQVGAAMVNVTPKTFPVLINGNMTSGSAASATTQIHARAIVLDDGRERIAMVVVDSCMMSRPFLDEVKSMASKRTGIATNRILISATHAHSVPASMGCLGTDADENYVPFLRLKIVEAIEVALSNLAKAKVGWAVANASNYTAVRHWVRRPDRIADDPFGNKTVRANMHAGRVWDDVTGEAGPEDPDLSMIAFQTETGEPIALLANFSMHYFGDKAVGADYFGRFCEGVQAEVGQRSNRRKAPFVAIMSHGCSGDIWRRDYTKQSPPEFETMDIDTYTRGLTEIAMTAYASIEYQTVSDIAMSEARLPMKYRVPDEQRLKWATEIVERLAGQLPKTQPEIYAREQVMLHEKQATEVVIQAIRIGSLAIATTPTETYALTGLKLKMQSPLERTMVIELANGGDGYIPPPEQHVLGGYNTWPARSAGLEVDAEPRIVAACLQQLERVCALPRRKLELSHGLAVEKILAQKPLAYWRLHETQGPWAIDASGNNLHGLYEPGVVFFLEGPDSKVFCKGGDVNRAIHLAGGRLRAKVPGLTDRYRVSMWFWNGMPNGAREIAGWMFSRGYDHELEPTGDAIGLIGNGEHAGKLVFQSGNRPYALGTKTVPRWTWTKVSFERQGKRVRLFLNDDSTPEIDCEAPFDLPLDASDVFVGGRGSHASSWEGRIDEVAIYP